MELDTRETTTKLRPHSIVTACAEADTQFDDKITLFLLSAGSTRELWGSTQELVNE